MPDIKTIRENIITKSKELEFDLIGFAPFNFLKNETENLKTWLSNSFHAGMEYMMGNIDKKNNVRKILGDCQSVISLGINYKLNQDFRITNGKGKISRYAWGRDYHLVIWEKLDELVKYIKTLEPSFIGKGYVDTGPVLDKAWAVRSGIGWLGKNSNVINREIGSWFFIANILTNLNFDDYGAIIPDFCGSCTACIDTCPTNAIVSEYVVDSNKCISYLTIENKNTIPDEFIDKFDNWIFGCDICQDICPWNIKFAVETNVNDFKSIRNQYVDLNEVDNLTNKKFNEKFKESPVLRTRLKGIKRNADFLKKSLNP